MREEDTAASHESGADPLSAAAASAVAVEEPASSLPRPGKPVRQILEWPAARLAWPLAIGIAVLGGLLGIIGAILEELRAGGLLGAPIIEEALKPTGVYIVLLCWPATLRNHRDTALLTAIGGLVFGLIESLIYVKLYFPHASDGFVLFRFTVPVALHVICSTIMGSGLDRGIFDWAAGRSPFPKLTKRRYLTATGIHMAYNITVIILAVAGILSFRQH